MITSIFLLVGSIQIGSEPIDIGGGMICIVWHSRMGAYITSDAFKIPSKIDLAILDVQTVEILTE